MKKLSIIIALSAWLLQACSSHTKSSDSDTTTAIKDTATRMVLTPEKEDVDFATEAASGGMAEVELGKLAQQKGQNKRVKRFGAMMVMDHSKTNDKLAALAITKKITLPNAPNAAGQKIIDELSKLSGKDFDKAYVDDMIDDHKNDIKAFERATKICRDPDIKAFAAKTLPRLKAHLDAINAVHDSMK
jgi:putative membrane protein